MHFNLALGIFGVVFAAMGACAPLPADEQDLGPVRLTWTAGEGPDRVYASNSAIRLRLFVGAADSGTEPQGNIVIKATRGGDKVTPALAPVPTHGELVVLVTVGGAGEAGISATLGGHTTTLDLEISDPDPSKTTFTFEPNTVVAGDQAALATLWAKDNKGRNLTGVSVDVSAADANTHVRPKTLTTSGSGRDVASVIAYATGPHALQVEGHGLSFSPTLHVGPAGMDRQQSSLTLTPLPPLADGSLRASVVVQVVDVYGNPMADAPIKLRSNVGHCTFDATEGVTDTNGAFATALSSIVPGLTFVLADVFPKKASAIKLVGQTLL